MASQNGIGDEIQALVQALRESQPPADRLSTATRLLELLSAADGGGRSQPPRLIKLTASFGVEMVDKYDTS